MSILEELGASSVPSDQNLDHMIRTLQTEVAYLRKELDEEKILSSELATNMVKIAEELKTQRSVLVRCCELASLTERKVSMWPFVPTK